MLCLITKYWVQACGEVDQPGSLLGAKEVRAGYTGPLSIPFAASARHQRRRPDVCLPAA